MNSPRSETPVLVIGAGMTGLMVALSLGEQARNVTLLDKGRSVGGRLATRRVHGLRADHGAQFFTARSAAFQRWVAQWRDEGLLYTWSQGWSDGSLAADGHAEGDAHTSHDGHDRYAVRGGMNALAKAMAAQAADAGATIATEVRVAAIQRSGAGWRLTDEAGSQWHAAALVVTAPVPQTLALLDAGGIALHADDRQALEAIRYAPSLCLLIEVEGTPALPEPGALQRPDAVAAWVADNQRKGIDGEGQEGAPPDRRIVTVHASPAFSTAHYGAPDDEVAERLAAEVASLLDGCSVIGQQLKRWRYALPTTVHSERMVRARDLPPLWFAGDAFGGPRVEGAALSGMAVADNLRRLFDGNAPG
jgi:predicted NAD/FAD-dependent oxidoreductase